MDSDKPDFTEQYSALLSSPFGKDLVGALTELHDSLIKSAEDELDNEYKAHALLKQAGGVMLCISHLKGKATAVLTKASRNRGT